ncbi:hypothetical protein [Amycolatopsis minnesotensis]|uniref:Secreted protein n=1 Tax=Amycolatopsis minnesotensis TaxID=337894 RepID=A0ABN2SFJ7_9PSEU
MHIEWGALGTVFVVAIAVVAVLTSLFAVGVRGLSQRAVAREGGASGTSGMAVAVACFAVCAGIVGYGIYLIVA